MVGYRSRIAILHCLSNLVVCPEIIGHSELEFVWGLGDEERGAFLAIAEVHRVLLRCLRALKNCAQTCSTELPGWVSPILGEEERKAHVSIAKLALVCRELSAAGVPVVVIKSLDHWPDLGGDFDVYAAGQASDIERLMCEKFHAVAQAQSWADRLAGKWRFRIPGLGKLIEIHLGGLGQAGQQSHLGRSALQRRTTESFGGIEFSVPSAEDQILIRTLDSFYRHYSLRICDIMDTAQVVRGASIDFSYLKHQAKRAGIQKGLCSFLAIVDGYCWRYRNQHLCLPSWVRKSATFGVDKIYADAALFRIPLFPQGAGLFRRELTKAIRRKDIKKAVRTGLIPPLAIAAMAQFRIRGRDKGIW